MPEDLDAAFQLADKTMRKRRDDGKDTDNLVFPLSNAVQYAIKIEPDLTVAHIEMIYLPFEKAEMLRSAASSTRGSSSDRKEADVSKDVRRRQASEPRRTSGESWQKRLIYLDALF